MVSAYQFSCLPIDHPDYHMTVISVEWRGADTFTVMHNGSCLNKSGGWKLRAATVEPHRSVEACLSPRSRDGQAYGYRGRPEGHRHGLVHPRTACTEERIVTAPEPSTPAGRLREALDAIRKMRRFGPDEDWLLAWTADLHRQYDVRSADLTAVLDRLETLERAVAASQDAQASGGSIFEMTDPYRKATP